MALSGYPRVCVGTCLLRLIDLLCKGPARHNSVPLWNNSQVGFKHGPPGFLS